MRIRNSKERVVFDIISYLTIILVTLFCLIPFILVISGSFTSERSIHADGYWFWPKEFSLDAYDRALKNPAVILRAYGVTVLLTLFGSILGLFLTSLTSFALQRPNFKYRNFFALYFYFTTLFTGGLVPFYILMIKYLHLKDSYLALLFPYLFTVFDIIVMRSFMKSIPEALSESAKIDGAGEFTIFIRIYFPLSKPALATVGLFIALRYWNDWYTPMLFISDEKMYPLQYLLYNMLTKIEFAMRASQTGGVVIQSFPTEAFKLAMTVIATGPIVLLYPFLQKYFIRGLTVGAVKG